VSTIETTTEGSARVNPADNIDKWIESRDAKPEPAEKPEPVVAEPEEETPAAPPPAVEPTEGNWWETGLTDVSHGFLKGRKGPEVEKAFRHVETAKQKAEREREDLRREIDQLRRQQQEPPKVQAAPPTQQPTEDEIERNWFDNPAIARQKIEERARAIADESIAKYEATQEQKKRQQTIISTGSKAYEDARTKLNIDEETWELRSPGVMLHLTNERSPFYGDGHNLMRADAYVDAYKALYGDPTPPPVVVKPAPEPPNPPGAKKAAAVTDHTPAASPLSAEEREARRVVAEAAGLDVERFIKRGERKR